MKKMKALLKLSKTIEEHRIRLFNDGYSYNDADEMVKLAFEETGLKFGLFTSLKDTQINNAIRTMNNILS